MARNTGDVKCIRPLNFVIPRNVYFHSDIDHTVTRKLHGSCINENEKEGKTRCKNGELKLIVSSVEELAELP